MRKLLFCCLTLCLAACSKKNEPVSFNVVNDAYAHDYTDAPVIEETEINPLLTEDYGLWPNGHHEQSKPYYVEALRLYEANELDRAITKLEAAIETYPYAVYYYLYGVCFMDKREYGNAERAFYKAIQFCDWDPPYLENNSPMYTFDHNGAYRERYFSYYNLACIYSLTGRLELSLDYLKRALRFGYPYIDHVYADADLANLLNSSGDSRGQIQKVYDDGFINTASGRSYNNSKESEVSEYFFLANSVENHRNRDLDYVRSGTYEIKNYQIIIQYHRETGKKREGSVPFEHLIDDREIMCLGELADNKWGDISSRKR